MAKIKMKTHKGAKKRFKVSANGKVSHKKCGSSHLMSHKSGKQVRNLRRKQILSITAEAHRLRRALHENEGTSPGAIAEAKGPHDEPGPGASAPAAPA